jgi:predicted DsbA family dithiol-disulfide isomerase
MRTVVEVEIWSDVVCPWCYIGKRRFERAVDAVADDIDVRMVYRPYQLDPTASPGVATPVVDAYAKKFGGPERAAQIVEHLTSVAADEGLEFHMDRALRVNTLLAHRLLWLSEPLGVQLELKEQLLQSYFIDGRDVGDLESLADIAASVGLDRDAVAAFLASTDGLDEVQALVEHARNNDITAVPTFVVSIEGSPQSWMIPGAQDTDVFVRALRRLAARTDG